MSSVIYGGADFAGGLASRRNDGVVVTVVSQVFGALALTVAILLWPEVTVTDRDLIWGALGGIGGGLGLMCFYPALGQGPMSVVAPTTALFSALSPLVFGLWSGERPGGLAVMGIAVALPAIVLVAREPSPDADITIRRATLLLAMAAGVGFGLFFIAFAQTSADAGLWPLAAARAGSISLVGLICLLGGRGFRITPGDRWLVALAGVADITANAFYLMAATRGLLSLVAVLGSLYPATTVLLAVIILGERLAPVRLVGLVLAGVAVVCIAAGS
jgi:drug/metabolite transporter (DMT)-like permease